MTDYQNEIPSAQLHIYYGWKLYDACYGDEPNYQSWKQYMIELMKQPGIFEHGRVGQAELIKEKAVSAIHYYASTIEEMDAMSVREFAAVGCVPVTTDYGVLKEKDYCVRISGNPYDQKTQEAVAQKVVELLKNQKQLEIIRQKSIESASASTWDKIAQLWIAELHRDC